MASLAVTTIVIVLLPTERLTADIAPLVAAVPFTVTDDVLSYKVGVTSRLLTLLSTDAVYANVLATKVGLSVPELIARFVNDNVSYT